MVLNHSRALGSPKVVLLGIANHLGPDATEGAWPSQQRLAEYANMSERGVQKCIEKLVALGELRVEVAGGVSRDKYKPNRYWVTIECPDDCDRSMSHRRGERQYAEGRTPVPLGTNAGTPRGEPQFVQTVSEPEEEPLLDKKRARMIPEQWKPSPDFFVDMESKFPSLQISNEVEAFVDFHRAKGNRFKDFDAAFRAWCRNALKWQTPAQRKAETPTPGPGKRVWVLQYHDNGDHWACEPGEFGCK